MNIIKILADVLTEAAKNEQVPDVRFKMNNSLGEEAAKLSGIASIQQADESNENRINRYLAEIVGAVDSETGEIKDLENIEFVNEICESISDKVSERLKATTAKLRTIHSEVTKLSNEINDRYNKTIAADPFLAKHVAEKDVVVFDYPEMRYDVLSNLGGVKNTVAYVIGEADSDETAMVLKSKFVNVIGKFASRKLITDFLETVQISKEQREEAVTKVCEQDDSLIASNVDDVIKIIANVQSLNSMSKRLVKTFEIDNGMESTIQGISIIADYKKPVQKIVASLSEMGIEIPANNVQFVDDMCDLCGFVVQFHRVNTFKGTILFRNKTLNPDRIKDMEAKQLTMQDLAQHVTYRYKNIDMPLTGVSLESLEQSKERIDNEVAKAESQNKIRIEAGLHDAKHKAFMIVMNEFLSQDEFSDKVVDVGSLRSYLVSCANKITNEGSSCEDVIYVIMEKLLYKNDFVMVLRKQLGMDYVKAVASNSKLSASDMAEVNAVVYARLLTEYMKSQFMECA